MERMVVSDTGPLISLERIRGGHQFIRKLFSQIIVPQVGMDELSDGDQISYISRYKISDLIQVHASISLPNLPEINRLHEGERQAIALALKYRLSLLIEEEEGRNVAQKAGIHVSGIAGQIVRAVRDGVIDVKEGISKLTEMRQAARLPKKLTQQLIDSISKR